MIKVAGTRLEVSLGGVKIRAFLVVDKAVAHLSGAMIDWFLQWIIGALGHGLGTGVF